MVRRAARHKQARVDRDRLSPTAGTFARPSGTDLRRSGLRLADDAEPGNQAVGGRLEGLRECWVGIRELLEDRPGEGADDKVGVAAWVVAAGRAESEDEDASVGVTQLFHHGTQVAVARAGELEFERGQPAPR
jgi:hypothetical protein